MRPSIDREPGRRQTKDGGGGMRPAKEKGFLAKAKALPCLALFLALLFLVGRGGRLLTVTSGSMSPKIPTGSLLLVRPVSFEGIQEGDVVTYSLADGKTLITHRVVEKDAQRRNLTTKGDANETVDLVKVPASRVQGKVVFSVPTLGYFLYLFRWKWEVRLATIALLILLGFLLGGKERSEAMPSRVSL